MNARYTHFSDANLLEIIRTDADRKAFEELYLRYFAPLFNYVYSRINDRFTSQEIVQELFVSIWQKRIDSNIQDCKSYLFSSAKKRIITHYRAEMSRQNRNTYWESARESSAETTYQDTLALDLQNRYHEALHLLPEKCRQVFTLSRQGISNRDVALELNISEKTVEQHITKALRILKVYLKEHLAYTLILINLF
ncbi:sigma-70 family RNA polymerase sigma factor [Dyadobacter sp. 3J3]|uniref:sigma-70 family RNA polymerase sigma factor n=1 Tax=Dyadobacter sp. 3J3 TaxID=2606600 RepID=UPI00135ACF90|nr:sigma-70 family RNA polymerase sigma factor [Dyadobacter sp. 3J3]